MEDQQERIYLLTGLYNREISIASVENIWGERVKQAKLEAAKVAMEQTKDNLEDI